MQSQVAHGNAGATKKVKYLWSPHYLKYMYRQTKQTCCFDQFIYYSLRKHAYSSILKILQPKKENFEVKKNDIFHILAHNIDCGYSLEQPQQDSSNKYPQSMFF